MSILEALRRLKSRRRRRRGERKYSTMQRKYYQSAASAAAGAVVDKDSVVGSWREHDAWPDYEEFLLRHVPHDGSWTALEYGCGPGRNIARWNHLFERIDGVDISAKNLDNAREYLASRDAELTAPRLFLTAGADCADAPSGAYDFAFSTICLQHICVHEIRFSILKDLFRCLARGGRISFQMGYGVPSPMTVDYHANHYDAETTNRGCDVAIESVAQIQGDLERVGFVDVEHWIRPVGPGDHHPNWIFLTGIKAP